MPDEESPLPPSLRNYKFVVVEIDEENDDLTPGYYLSALTPKGGMEEIAENRSVKGKINTSFEVQCLKIK